MLGIERYFASLLRSFYNLTDQFHEGWAKKSMHVYKTQLENYFLIICMPLSSDGFPSGYLGNGYRITYCHFVCF